MVRIISCHHFLSQDVFTIEGEPMAVCTAMDHLLIATLQHCVEEWDLTDPSQLLHRFPTVDQAKQMVYCQSGDYVGTLEVRSTRQAIMSFVRIYLNWQADMKGHPMRARIAGRVTPSSQSGVGHLEMIELPLKRQAFCISACSRTGNLAVGSGDIVSVFTFCVKTHDISRRPFYDLEPLIDISLSLAPHQLVLCEDVLACLAPNELHVLKLKLITDVSSESPSSKVVKEVSSPLKNEVKMAAPFTDVENYIMEDENFVVWPFSSSLETSDNMHAVLKERLHPDSWPLIIHLPGLAESSHQSEPTRELREVLGPSHDIPVTADVLGEASRGVNVMTLLYRRFLLDQEISSGLHSLHLIPMYQENKLGLNVEKPNFDNPLITKHGPPLLGLSCFFSSPQHGFLYDLLGPVRLVTSYPFTSSARAVVLEDHLLYAVTETGLETYTLRTNHCALQHLKDHQSEICPPLDDPVCLVGLQAFLNVEQLVLSHNRLVLLSAVSDDSASSQESDSNCWTVYSLSRPSPLDFYEDLLEVAQSHKLSSPATYIHLLGEAHCVLRGEELLQSAPEERLIALLQESCCLMGDFYILSESIEENHRAVLYYQKSGKPLQEIVERILQLKSKALPMFSYRGLMDYLNNCLLDKPCIVTVDQELADSILDLFNEEDPMKLSPLLLKGNLKGYSLDKAVNLLRKRVISKKAYPEDIVALSWLCVQHGQSDQVGGLLAILTKERLLDALVNNHYLWTVDNNKFSPLAQTVRQWRPDVFVEVLLQLVFSEVLPPNNVLLMFQEALPGIVVHKLPHFKEFLEALLTSAHKNAWSTNAPVQLASIYLARLKEGPPIRTTAHPVLRALNLFGPRSAWLNLLPPFDGRSLRDPCLAKQKSSPVINSSDVCPCIECNEDLLRLQSLMCHELRPPEVLTTILDAVSKQESLSGSLSLRILASSFNDVITLLAVGHPMALIQYAKETCADVAEKWNVVCNSLVDQLSSFEADTPGHNLFNQALQMLLSHLSEILPPAAFVNILPQGNTSVYIPHVQRCCQKYQASLLRDRIIAKGLELKGIV